MSDAAIQAMAEAVAKAVIPVVLDAIEARSAPQTKHVKGTMAIAKLLGVTDDTVKARGYCDAKRWKPGMLKIPICGTEPFKMKRKGEVKTFMRPIARAADLTLYVENLNLK